MDATPGAGPLIAGRYRIGARLGQGGMADVFDAFDERLERRVAVKALRPEVAEDAAMRQRFEREARAAARLTHPCVVGVYDSGEHAGRAFLVMERLPGETLADLIGRGPVPQDRLLPIAADLLAALEAAHDLGIIHRDIKPGNVLLAEDGRAKVADFGIAKVALPGPEDGDPTQVGLVLGTPAYLAPERLLGQPASVASDLYAAGVVLYESATGHKPPAGSGDATVVGGPTGLATTAAGTDLDPALVRVVGRAMAANPDDRYPSAGAMAADLTRGVDPTPPATLVQDPATTVLAAPVLGAQGPTVVTRSEDDATTVTPVAGERRRRGRLVALAALLALIVIAIIVVLLVSSGGGHRRQPTPTPASTTPTTAPTVSVPPPSVSPSTTPTQAPPSTTRTTPTTRAATTSTRTTPPSRTTTTAPPTPPTTRATTTTPTTATTRPRPR